MDINALAVGWTGGMAKWARAMGVSLIRSIRLNFTFAFYHSLQVDGKMREHATCTTVDQCKKHTKHRTSGVYQQCIYCGSKHIAEHRKNIKRFDQHLSNMEKEGYDPELDDDSSQEGRIFDKYDPFRDTTLHAMIC